MNGELYDRERQEAIETGERALHSLQAAYQEMKGARNWGIVDILGGGFLTTMIKRSKMDNARRLMENARIDLQRFNSELNDIQLNLQMDMFMGFFDYTDNFLADILVQSQINDAGRQLEDAMGQVEELLYKLKAQD